MSDKIKIIIFGESGVGKSYLSNAICSTSNSHGSRQKYFIEQGDPSGARAIACQSYEKRVRHQGEEKNMLIVDTPGFSEADFKHLDVRPGQKWKDVLEAFHLCKDKVDCFIIMMKTTNPKNSERVATLFHEYFGVEAELNAVVVFVDDREQAEGSRRYSNRKLQHKHFGYIQRIFRPGMLICRWSMNEEVKSLNEVMGLIFQTVEDEHPYTKDKFYIAQEEFSKKLIDSQMVENSSLRKEISKMGFDNRKAVLERLNIPHSIIMVFLKEKFILDILIPYIKKASKK